MSLATMRDQYKADYLALQKSWKDQGSSLLDVGRLSYWTYWISKIAEKCPDIEEQRHLFGLKRDGLRLLYQSDYSKLKRFVPDVHQRLCQKHYGWMKASKMNPHHHLRKYRKRLLSCEDCQEGEDHFFSLYSLAILDDIHEADHRHLLYIFYVPHPKFRDVWPDIDQLDSVQFYRGKEYGTIRLSKEDNKSALDDIFPSRLMTKKFNENYNKLNNSFSDATKTKHLR